MASNQRRSDSCITYVALNEDVLSLEVPPPTCSSAPGELFGYEAVCTCDAEDLEWSYSEE
ncbi:hypothetical protein C0J52_20091 [Blattella germanica]|nr:hypothetical protein C0J52_20091 [Blattella germanica]